MKKMIKPGVMVLVVAILLIIWGSGIYAKMDEQDKNSYRYYYVNGDETQLLPEAYDPEEETAEYMLQELITRLNDEQRLSDKASLLPEGVHIDSYEIRDTLLHLEFNLRYTQMGRTREILTRTGIVKTFVQVPGIDSVEIYVGKEPLTDTKGQTVGVLTEDSFVEMEGSDGDAYSYDCFTLYFTDSTGTCLVEEKRSVYYKRTIPKERVILEQLAKGPMEKGHYPVISENTAVVGVTMADGVCYADLNRAFVDSPLAVSEDVAVYAVVDSLLAAGDAQRVQILVNGETQETYGENMQLYHFYSWNEKLIRQEEEEISE